MQIGLISMIINRFQSGKCINFRSTTKNTLLRKHENTVETSIENLRPYQIY